MNRKLTKWHKTWLILASYALLAIILTHPTLWYLKSAASGGKDKDVLQYVWLMWWSKEALLTLTQLPSHLTVWNWPEGIYHPLLFVTPYLELTGLPITLVLGPMATYNIHLLLSFTLSGFTAYLLGYALTHNRLAGIAGGIIFAFCAHRWAHAFTGHLPHITVYWGPLFAWAMWRFVQKPDKRRGLWVGLTAGLMGLTHVMHVAYWLLPIALILFIWGWRNFGKDNPRWMVQVVKGGLWGLVPLLLLVGPFYGLFFTTLNQTSGDLEAGGLVGNATDLLAYLTPAPTNPVFAKLGLIPPLIQQFLPPINLDEQVAYLSLAGLLLAILGIIKYRRLEARPWIWLTLISGVLALGPVLWVGGKLVTYTVNDGNGYVLMPYALLANLPLLSWGRTTGRLNQTLMIGIGVLSAYGVLWLTTYFKKQFISSSLVIGLLAIFILESLVVFPFTQATPEVSPYYLRLQAEKSVPAGGILDLPLRNDEEINNAIFLQTYHRRPIVAGYIHRRFRSMERKRQFTDLLFRPAVDVPAFQEVPAEERLATLRSFNFTTVIVHKDLVDRAIDDAQVDFVATLLGEPVYEDNLITVYSVPPGERLQNPVALPRASNWTLDGLFPEPNSPRHVYLYAPNPTQINWSLQVTLMTGPTVLTLEANDLPTQRLLVTEAQQQLDTLTISVPAGLYSFDWVNNDACGEDEDNCYPLRFDRAVLNQKTTTDSPQAVWNENNLTLMRYSISFDQVTNQALLHFYWLPSQPSNIEPTIFIHILDAAGNAIAQVDHRILDGKFPPSMWLPNVLAQDVTPLPILKSDNWADYMLQIGLYDAATGTRFQISEPQTTDNSILLPLNNHEIDLSLPLEQGEDNE